LKAKEYFEKYGQDIWQEWQDPEVHLDGQMAKLYIEMSSELRKIMDVRHVNSDSGMLGVLREQNQKWNAIRNLFEKKYGKSPIQRNGFYYAWKDELKLPALYDEICLR
jgi:hypothetical protein